MKKGLVVLFASLMFFCMSCDSLLDTGNTAEVSSNTEWSGSFDGRTVSGSGNQSIELGNDKIICVVVQKQTNSGYLQVELDGNKKRTTAAYGVVSVCND